MPQPTADPFLSALEDVRHAADWRGAAPSRKRELDAAEARYQTDPRRPDEVGPRTYGKVSVIGPEVSGLPQHGPPDDPFIAALQGVRATRPAEQSLNTDPPSALRRLTDVLLTPLVSPEAAARVTGSAAPLPNRGMVGTLRDTWDAVRDMPRLLVEQPLATLRGGVAGAVEGAATLTDPITLASVVTGVVSRAVRPALVTALRALPQAERAIIAARAAGNLDEIARLRTEIQSVRSEAELQRVLLRFARGVDVASGGTLTARGVERIAAADSLPEVGAGLAEAAIGAIGVRTAARVPERPAAIPLHAGELPPARGFIADEAGRVARIADAPDAFLSALADVRAPTATGAPDPSRVQSVPAVIAGREFDGAYVTRKMFSSDPTAMDAPKVQITTDETRELRRMVAELESVPFTKRSFVEGGARRGGDLEVVGGAAGAEVYQDIIKPLKYQPTRGEVLKSIKKFLSGEHNALGQEALDVARFRMAGDRSVSRPILPPEAGDLPTGGGRAAVAEEGFDRFAADVDDLAQLGGASEPGEAGFIRPALLTRVGAGAAGAATGAATGEDTNDRVTRALLFGAAGAAAPSLLARGPARTTVTEAVKLAKIAPASPAGVVRFAERSPIPRAGEIPTSRLREFPSLQKQPEGVRDEIASILEQHSGFAAQRRGVQSVERTQALAERIDVPLRQLRPGKALNAEELTAYRDATASVMTKRQPLAEKIKSGQATDLDKLEFSKLTDEGTVLIANYRGAKAEAGRALNILRQKARILELGDSAFIQAALKAPGFDENTRRIAAAVAEAGGDPIKQLEILRRQAGGTLFEKGQAVYYNSLLSGVKTHLRNTIGNSFNALANLVTPLGAAPLDVARSAITGAPRDVFLGEMPQAAVATFTALPKAFQDFAFTMRHGFTPMTVERAASGVFDAPRVEVPGGMLTNWPSRLLESSDVFFRTLARNQELYAGAYAAARKGRPSGTAQRMVELIAGMGPESQALHARAEAFAARAVFQEDPGAFVNHLLRIKNDPKVPVSIRTAATFVVPFVRTPANILRQGLEFSPAGFGMKAARSGGREGSQALGRAALGSMALAPMAYLAATGQLSGNGPTNPGERTALLEKGWQPNSVKIGDRWIRYQLFQPLSVPMAAMANAYERFSRSDRSDKSAEESFGAAIAGLSASFLDQSFLSGLNGLLEAVNDPDRNAQRFLSTFAQGLVPGSGLLRNVAQAVDPVLRKPEGVAESVKTIIPGLSRTVPARQTRFGEDVVRQGGPIRRGFVVPEVSTEKRDLIADTMKELDIHPQVPRARLVRDGKTVPVSRDQEQIIVKAIGKERRARLARIINGGRFARLPEDTKRRLVEDALADATREVNRRAVTRIGRGSPLSVEMLAPAVGQ